MELSSVAGNVRVGHSQLQLAKGSLRCTQLIYHVIFQRFTHAAASTAWGKQRLPQHWCGGCTRPALWLWLQTCAGRRARHGSNSTHKHSFFSVDAVAAFMAYVCSYRSRAHIAVIAPQSSSAVLCGDRAGGGWTHVVPQFNVHDLLKTNFCVIAITEGLETPPRQPREAPAACGVRAARTPPVRTARRSRDTQTTHIIHVYISGTL